MNRLFSFAALTALVFLLSGCIPVSLRPWYAENDVIFDPDLAGVYVEKSGDKTQTTTITRDGAKGYLIQAAEASDKGQEEIRYRLRLFQIGNDRFIDYAPAPPDDNHPPVMVFPAVEGHVVEKVVQVSPRLQTVGLNYNWLENYLIDHPYALRHEFVEEDDKNGTEQVARHDLVLTASTAALRRFLHDHANDPKAFPPPDPNEGLERD